MLAGASRTRFFFEVVIPPPPPFSTGLGTGYGGVSSSFLKSYILNSYQLIFIRILQMLEYYENYNKSNFTISLLS
jgi:hypothetical protein